MVKAKQKPKTIATPPRRTIGDWRCFLLLGVSSKPNLRLKTLTLGARKAVKVAPIKKVAKATVRGLFSMFTEALARDCVRSYVQLNPRDYCCFFNSNAFNDCDCC